MTEITSVYFSLMQRAMRSTLVGNWIHHLVKVGIANLSRKICNVTLSMSNSICLSICVLLHLAWDWCRHPQGLNRGNTIFVSVPIPSSSAQGLWEREYNICTSICTFITFSMGLVPCHMLRVISQNCMTSSSPWWGSSLCQGLDIVKFDTKLGHRKVFPSVSQWKAWKALKTLIETLWTQNRAIYISISMTNLDRTVMKTQSGIL